EAPVTREERQLLLQRVVADTGLNVSPSTIQQALDSLTGLNLYQSDNAIRSALTRKFSLDKDFPKHIMQYKREQMAAQNLWEVMDTEHVPNLVGWDKFEEEIQQNAEYGTFDLNSPHNVQMYLLIGQAGTGKTTMARKMGQMLNRPVYLANIASWMGSLMGQTEQRMRAAIDSIYAAQPCIAVIDEAQRVLQAEDQKTGGGTMNRAVQSLLTRMEQGRQNGDQVLWVLTANERSNLPPELFRRGRTWAVHFPGPKTRVGIFDATFQRYSSKDHRMRRDYNLTDSTIAQITQGYGGGDIEQLISRAAVVGRGIISEDSLRAASNYVTKQENITPEVIAKRREELKNYPSVSSDHEEGIESSQLQTTKREKPYSNINIPTPRVKPTYHHESKGNRNQNDNADEINILIE
ncbi:MAG TPA: ATP-binding protein, partial [Candidatus Woesebacteria bacterium]|nr:ATP-binding protein [Candidatus Woesebacteria bacterium]